MAQTINDSIDATRTIPTSKLTEEGLFSLIVELQQTAQKLKGTNSGYLMTDAANALIALQEYRKTDSTEPVYQIKGEKGGEWHDFSKLSFYEFVSGGGEGRILYTEPQPKGDDNRD